MDEPQTPKPEPEYELDIAHLPKQEHSWVRRGIKLSCEGAGHPHHSHFLTKRERIQEP